MSMRSFFWCDSQIVLGYINSDAKRFHVFVANRVQFIRDHTRVDQWQYVSTGNNPADHASRGLTAAELLDTNWFTGPQFLWNTDAVQTVSIEAPLLLSDPEVRSQALNVQSQSVGDLLERFGRYSDWNFLTRIVARIRRMVHSKPQLVCLAVEEIEQAGLCIIRLAQQVVFGDDWQALDKGKKITSSSKLFSLNPFIADRVVRVGGRLANSSLPFNQKHPILLPAGHVAQLIIAGCHGQVSHQGRGQTLNQLRSRGYWIVNGSRLVANYIRRYVHCRRFRRPVEEQRMADLPQDHVEASPPFTYVGMNCFGPFVVRKGRSEIKRYGLLLTCLSSRAVHIEMLDDMTTDALINALRCFIAIRGAVRHIRCDQGSNFIGAKNELAAATRELHRQNCVIPVGASV